MVSFLTKGPLYKQKGEKQAIMKKYYEKFIKFYVIDRSIFSKEKRTSYGGVKKWPTWMVDWDENSVLMCHNKNLMKIENSQRG